MKNNTKYLHTSTYTAEDAEAYARYMQGERGPRELEAKAKVTLRKRKGLPVDIKRLTRLRLAAVTRQRDALKNLIENIKAHDGWTTDLVYLYEDILTDIKESHE